MEKIIDNLKKMCYKVCVGGFSMCESEFVVLYSDKKDIYCKTEYFEYNSEKARKAHEEIRKLKKEGCKIIDIEKLSENEVRTLISKMDKEIDFYSYKYSVNINVIIKSDDIYSVFNADGSCNIKGLESSTKEISTLLQNPNNISKLKKIKAINNITDEKDKVTDGYMIPMIAYGDTFSLEEAANIFDLKSIRVELGGIDLCVALDMNDISNFLIRNKFQRASQSKSSSAIEDFKKEKESSYKLYESNFSLIQLIKNKKEKTIEVLRRKKINM